MLLRVVSKCTAPTVFWTAQFVSLFNPALPLLFTVSLSRLHHYLTYFQKELPPALNIFVCLTVFFSGIHLFPLTQPSTSFSRQLSWVGLDIVCLSLNSSWWAVSCFTQTYASCCSFEIFNHVQINIWLLQFSFLVLLNHCCLSSDISGMLQPGSFWFLNNATSGFSMTVGALICPIYKIW